MNDFGKVISVLILFLIIAVSVYRYTLSKTLNSKIAEQNKQELLASKAEETKTNAQEGQNGTPITQEEIDKGKVAGSTDQDLNRVNADDYEGISPDNGNKEDPQQVNNLQGDNMDKKLAPEDKIKFAAPEGMIIDKSKEYTATIKTDKGDIKVKLADDIVPNTVNNFVYLAKSNFYNDIPFHRIIDGFMIQTGDPLGNGTGGPNYRFKDEVFEGTYKRGTVAMANAGPDTNGSQFFIMHKDNLGLPKNYVIFGEVTEGLDVVDKIATVPVKASPMGETSVPVEPVKMISVEIEEK